MKILVQDIGPKRMFRETRTEAGEIDSGIQDKSYLTCQGFSKILIMNCSNFIFTNLLVLCMTILFSCSAHSKISKRDNIKGIVITQFLPLIDETGKVTGYDTSCLYLYYYKGMELYSDSLKWDYYIEGKQPQSKMLPNFFVVIKGKNYGYLFSSCRKHIDSCSGMWEKKVPVDSFLNIQWYMASSKSKPTNFTLVSEEKNLESGILKRHYTGIESVDTTITGELLLEYTNDFQFSDYSLNKQFDTVSNMKLYKVNTIVNLRKIKGYRGVADSVIFISEMKNDTGKNKFEMLEYFKRTIKEEED